MNEKLNDWRVSQVGDELRLQYGKSLPADARASGSVPVYGSNGVVGHHNQAAVEGPGIVIGRKGSVGEVAFSCSSFWPIDTTYFVENPARHNWLFLYFFLSHLGLTALNSHSAVPGLNRESVYPLPFNVPPKGEQEKIAAVLWRVQKAVEVQDKLVRTTRELKAAAMRRLFTHGLQNEPLKETEIGPMPKSWEPRVIPQLCHIISGGTPRKSVAEYWAGDIPWVSGKDLKLPALDDVVDHVSKEGIEAGSRLAPKDSVLLLVRGMGLAKDLPVAVINRPMAFNQDVKALVSHSGYSGSFLRSAIYAGKERLLSQIVPSAHGTMTLNLDDVESFKIPCPSDPAEAEEIGAILRTLDRKITLHEKKRVAFQDLFQTLLHQFMTARIRVHDLDIDTSEIAA